MCFQTSWFLFLIISLDETKRTAAESLLATIDVINETVGDAISDMLLVEIILQKNGWDVRDWLQLYNDLPNIQKKVIVADRNVIETTDAERKCVSPQKLQEEIDKVVSRYPKGRSFVRPSGTEDVVRVYAEAETTEVFVVSSYKQTVKVIQFGILFSFKDTENLAHEICNLVHELAGGVGNEFMKNGN